MFGFDSRRPSIFGGTMASFREVPLGALWNSVRDSIQSKVQKVEPENTWPAATQEFQIPRWYPRG